MEEQEFQKILPKVRIILAFVLENPYSDFYRNKYKGLNLRPENIKTYKDFCKIPLLTKDEILSLPMEQRFFVPKEKVFRYSVSSGTTNHNRPLILPHVVIEPKDRGNQAFNEATLRKLGVDKLFGLLPVNSVLGEIILEKDRTIPVISADVQKLDLAVSLANELKIEAIISSPTILYSFTEKLKKTSFNLTNVKWISIGSEFCTIQKFEYFKEAYPNAYFRLRYGNSEVGRYIGYRCEHLLGCGPQIFHPSETNLVEVLQTENDDIPGQIIFTHLFKEGFPLIRYQTNDYAKEEICHCRCGQMRTIDTSGRKDFDVLKTSGVIIHTQAIANAVESVTKYIEPDFQMHVYEESREDKLVTRLVLDLIPKKECIDKTELARFIQNQLQVSFDKTLTDLVNTGYFLPLEVNFVQNQEKSTKSKHIISHLRYS